MSPLVLPHKRFLHFGKTAILFLTFFSFLHGHEHTILYQTALKCMLILLVTTQVPQTADRLQYSRTSRSYLMDIEARKPSVDVEV